MAKQKVTNKTQSIEFYIGLVIQRISLLLAAASTMILWATLISIGHGVVFLNLQGGKINNPVAADAGITNEINKLTHYAVFFSLLSVALTLALMALPRVRKYEKKMVATGLVIAVFCFIYAADCQSIYHFILTRVAN